MTSTPVQILRQSTIGAADTCLKRLEFIYSPEPIPKKGSVNRGIGTGYHAGLAHSYQARMLGDTWTTQSFAREVVEVAVNTFDADHDENEVYDWRYQVKAYRTDELVFDRNMAVTKISEALARYFSESLYWPEPFQVIAVELSFDQAWIPGWNRSGTIDLVLWDGARYILVDHKTSKKKWAKNKGMPSNAQAAWYIHAWQQHAGLDELTSTFYYDVMGLNDETFTRRHAPRTQNQIDLTLSRGADIARLIEQGGPFPPNVESFLCSEAYCDFWTVCPYGSGLSFEEEAA
jgi:hypothetical protein